MPKQLNTSIPLLCDLCPKKPRFSDVSHLLTHISSKSHLSNRFKLQIRSQGEPEAKKLLDNFDNWYSKNGLEDLLSERLAAKEQKKATKRVRITSVSAKANVKAEVKAEDTQEQPLAATPVYRPPIPSLHSWSTDPHTAGFSEPSTGNPWTGSAVYETPTMRRSIPNFARNQSPVPPSTGPVLPSSPTPMKADDTEDEAERDGSKLKGVYWPGMDLFDSATAEMKRMRNQKKDGTALKQMKRSSAEIEPTEWIFNADGEFRRARDIFDESTESSPVRSVVAPTPKKRRGRKGALAEMSSNAPRVRVSTAKSNKRAAAKRKLTTADLDEVAPKKRTYPTHLSMMTNIQFSPSVEEHEGFRPNIGDLGKRRQFDVFHDAEEHSPAHTESPLEDHRFDFSIVRPGVPNKSANITQNSPTPAFKPVPVRFSGKENNEPGYINRRFMSAAAIGFRPDIFQSDSLNPLYTHSQAHAFSYGDRQSLQPDIKPGFSSYGGDFKPLMMTDPFRGIMDHHGLPNISGPSIEGSMHYGM